MLRRCCVLALRQGARSIPRAAAAAPFRPQLGPRDRQFEVRRWLATEPETPDSSDDAGPGLGERAKIATANALLKSLLSSTNGFDSAFDGLKIVRMGDGDISCSLDVDKKLENPFNSLHGGAICTLVDFAGTLALMTKDPTRAGVSVDLSVSFMSSAKAGDVLDIKGKVLKTGKKLGFTEVEIYNKDSGKLIASGRHTKYFS